MRTLDEVIEIASDWTNGFDEMFFEKQMLHYLRAFRDAKNVLDAERERAIEAYCQWKDAKEKLEAQTSQMMWVDKHFQFEISDNPPLTWDELNGMEGKPVWVEYNLHLCEEAHSQRWIIIEQFYPWRLDDELIYYGGFVFGKKEMGETWKAYQKEWE